MNIVQDIEDELDAIADASASMVYHEIKNFHLLGKARAEIIRLRTAVALIGECADEFKLENERLRDALRELLSVAAVDQLENLSICDVGSERSKMKNRAVASRCGMLLGKLRKIARAALEEKSDG